jgi:hypothetical protein
MWSYSKLVARCKRLAKCDVLRDRYTILAWRLTRRAKRLARK